MVHWASCLKSSAKGAALFIFPLYLISRIPTDPKDTGERAAEHSGSKIIHSLRYQGVEGPKQACSVQRKCIKNFVKKKRGSFTPRTRAQLQRNFS